jgi:hypothetical protein
VCLILKIVDYYYFCLNNAFYGMCIWTFFFIPGNDQTSEFIGLSINYKIVNPLDI